MLQKYTGMIPDPLNRQFNIRVSKPEAIARKDERNKLTTQLFPADYGTCFVRYVIKYGGLVYMYILSILYFCSF